MKNVAYDEDNNFLQTLAGVGLVTGVGYGAYKYNYDREGFDNVLNRVRDKVYPEVAVSGNAYVDRIAKLRSNIAEGSKKQRVTNKALLRSRRKRDKEKMDGIATEIAYHSKADRDKNIKPDWARDRITSREARWNIDNVGEVKDIIGNSIGSHYKKALEELGFEVEGAPTFKGTEATFKIRHANTGGKSKELKIRFAKYDSLTSQWLGSTGHGGDYVAKRALMYSNGGGKINASYTDINSYMLATLKDKKMLMHSLSRNETHIRKETEAQLAKARTSGANIIDMIYGGGKVDTVEKLQLAIDQIGIDHYEMVVRTADLSAIKIGTVMPASSYHLQVLDESDKKYKGLGKSKIDSSPGSMSSERNVTISGEGLNELAALPGEIQKDNSRLSVSTFDEKTGTLKSMSLGKASSRMTKRNMHGEALLATDAPMNIGYLGSSGDISERAMQVIHNMGGTDQAEKAKSTKSLSFSEVMRGTDVGSGEGAELDRVYYASDLTNKQIEGLNIKRKELKKLRSRLMVVDPESTVAESGVASWRKIISAQEHGGSINFFGVVTPWIDDAFSMEASVAKRLTATQEVQATIKGFLIGDKAKELSAMTTYIYTDPKSWKAEKRVGIMADMMKAEWRREYLSDPRNKAEWNGNIIKGITDYQGQISSGADLQDAIDLENGVIKSRAKEIMTTYDYLDAYAENESKMIKDELGNYSLIEGAEYKLYSRQESLATKMGAYSQTHRGTVAVHEIGTGDTRSANELIGDILKLSGSKSRGEHNLASRLFSKVFPKVSSGGLKLEKGAPGLVPALFGFMNGSIISTAETGKDIIVGGDAYNSLIRNLTLSTHSNRKIGFGDSPEEFERILGKYKKGGDLNLTSLFMSGDMAWNPFTSNKDLMTGNKSATQLEDIVSLFGQIRENAVTGNNRKITSLDVMQNGKNYDQLLSSHISLMQDWEKAHEHFFGKPADGETAESFFVNLRDSMKAGKVSREKAAAFSFSYFGGWSPNESMAMSQGSGLNEVRIPLRDLEKFALNKPGVVKELITRSTSNPQSIIEQLSLINESVSSDKDVFKKHIDSYRELTGGEIPIYTGEDLIEKFGQHIVSNDYVSALKDADSGLFKTSIFSEDVNPHGFVLQGKSGEYAYIGGADILGGATYLGETGSITMREGGMSSLKLMRDVAKSGGSVEEFDAYRAAMIAEHSSSKSGAALDAGIKIRSGEYSAHTSEFGFIHNTELKHAVSKTGNRDLQEVFGNIITVSQEDYVGLVEQHIKDALGVAKESGITTAQAMNEIYGNEHFLSTLLTEKQFKGLEKLDGKDAGKKIRDISKKFMDERIKGVKDAKRSILGLGTSNIITTPEGIVGRLKGHLMPGFVKRDPFYARSSASLGWVIPDASGMMNKKQIALGDIIALNLDTDKDGDKHGLVSLNSKDAIEETQAVIRSQQMETARITKIAKGKDMWKQTVQAARKSDEVISLLGTVMDGKSHATEIMSELHSTLPKSTALAMYMTKSLTGSFNIQANEVKNWYNSEGARAKINQADLENLLNFSEVVPSILTEREVISSKHLEDWIGKNNITHDNLGDITGLFKKTSVEEIEGIIRRSNGDMHPVIKSLIMEHKDLSKDHDALYRKASNLQDIQTQFKSFWNPASNVNREAEFKEAVGLAFDTPDEINRAWEKHKTLAEGKYAVVQEGGPRAFLSEEEVFKKIGLEGKSQMDMAAMALKNAGNNIEAVSSDSVNALLSKMANSIKSGNYNEAMQIVGDWSRRSAIGKATDILVSDGSQRVVSKKRQLIGKESFDKLAGWVKEAPLRRSLEIGAIGMLGLAAMNILSGDGTPQDPNDLPSVNNPSFSNRKTNHVAGRRTLDNSPGHNASVDLLSDSSVNYDTAMGNIDGLVRARGYNSISVRHDGTDPYKADMFRYT